MCAAAAVLAIGCGPPLDDGGDADPVGAEAATALGEGEPQPEAAEFAAAGGDLEVHFLDVGQADATLFVHDEVTVLIDAGHWQRSDVVPYLREQGVDQLDLLVVTHPHADHIGQFDQVMESFHVDEVWWSGATTTTATFERALDALDASDAAYEEPRAGDQTSIGPLSIDVLGPAEGASLSDLHESSVAMRVTYGEVAFVLTGDAEAGAEATMVAEMSGRLAAEVLSLGHHGSSTSTTADFLATVDPTVAVYSAGQNNTYGHPHAEIVDRVGQAGVELYGTDVHGHVVVTTDGTELDVATTRPGEPSAGSRTASSEGESGDAPPTPVPAGDGCESSQVDINQATLDELQQIVHIGGDRAEQIVALRPLSDLDGLIRVDGIGDQRLDDIRTEGVACVG